MRLPKSNGVEHFLNDALIAPQHAEFAGNLFAFCAAFTVMDKVDAGAGAVVFANGVDGFVGEAAFVFGQGLRL